MNLSDFLVSFKQKLTTSQKASLFFVLLFLLILPLSLAAILIPTQLKNRASEPITPPVITPSPVPTIAPILVCDPACYFGPEQCNDRITPIPGSGYGCQINSACSKDCTPEKIRERGNNYWCTAYCKQIIPTATPTPIVSPSPTITLTPTGSISPTPTPSQSSCRAIDKIITVTPDDGSETCHDIQEAINAVLGDGYEIKVASGSYQLKVSKYNLDQEYNTNLLIKDKVNLMIVADEAGKTTLVFGEAVRLNGPAGILWYNSSGSMKGFNIDGKKQWNSGITLRKSSGARISFNTIRQTENAIEAYQSTGSFSNNKSDDNYRAFYITDGREIKINNNEIIGRDTSVEAINFINSDGQIEGNLISHHLIGIGAGEFSRPLKINHNTIVGNGRSGSAGGGGLFIHYRNNNIEIKNNIIANNQSRGINDSLSNSAVFKYNNVWGNGQNYHGIDKTGIDGNISKDPLFGPNYCLMPGSPALKTGENGTDMGAMGECSLVDCPLKSEGDANCDNKVDLADFFIWRNEFLKYIISIVPPTTGWKSDFNNDSKVDLKDFFVWRKGFLSK